MRIPIVLLSGLATFSAVFAADAASSAAAPATTPAPAASAPAGPPPPLVFANYGFRINALDAGTDMPVVPAVQMYLPSLPLPSDNRLTFAPNVYVQLVPYLGTMKDYIADSTAKMQSDGYIIRAQNTLSADEWQVEYIAVLNGLPMHWYAKATHAGYRVYYAAGGVPDEMWNLSVTADHKTLGDILKGCVNSLGITGTAPELKFVPAQASTPGPVPAASTTPAAAPAASTAKATGAPAKATGTSK